MKREDKIKFRIERAKERVAKKKERNELAKRRKQDSNLDCPFDVDINGLRGTCTCGGENYESCMGDI